MGVLRAEFDEIAFGLIRQAVETRTHALLKADMAAAAEEIDGAAGVSASSGVAANGSTAGQDTSQKHPARSATQCRADAVFELLTGRRAGTPQPPLAGEMARAGTQMVIVADIGVIDGTRPSGRCEIILSRNQHQVFSGFWSCRPCRRMVQDSCMP